MSRTMGRTLTFLALLVVMNACGDDNGTNPYPDPVTPPAPTAVVTATGDIAAKVEEFRTLLGGPSNGGMAGEQPAGRREIGWDGAGAIPFNNRNDFPAAFFNTNVKSGAVFTTPGTGFRNDTLKFVEVKATYDVEFGAFSPKAIFTPVGSNVMDVIFQVAGQPTPAQVTGFGVVLSDVDVLGPTKVEFFDVDGTSLTSVTAPVRTDLAGFSFAAARFANAVVARVRITLGNGALGAAVNDISAGGTADLVVTDNFIYGEPKRIP